MLFIYSWKITKKLKRDWVRRYYVFIVIQSLLALAYVTC